MGSWGKDGGRWGWRMRGGRDAAPRKAWDMGGRKGSEFSGGGKKGRSSSCGRVGALPETGGGGAGGGRAGLSVAGRATKGLSYRPFARMQMQLLLECAWT